MHADSQSVKPVQPQSKIVTEDINSDATPSKVSKTAEKLHCPSSAPHFCTALNLPIKLLSDSQSESPLSNCFLGEEENQQDNHYWRNLVQTPEISSSKAKSFTIPSKFNLSQENAKLEKELQYVKLQVECLKEENSQLKTKLENLNNESEIERLKKENEELKTKFQNGNENLCCK